MAIFSDDGSKLHRPGGSKPSKHAPRALQCSVIPKNLYVSPPPLPTVETGGVVIDLADVMTDMDEQRVKNILQQNDLFSQDPQLPNLVSHLLLICKCDLTYFHDHLQAIHKLARAHYSLNPDIIDTSLQVSMSSEEDLSNLSAMSRDILAAKTALEEKLSDEVKGIDSLQQISEKSQAIKAELVRKLRTSSVRRHIFVGVACVSFGVCLLAMATKGLVRAPEALSDLIAAVVSGLPSATAVHTVWKKYEGVWNKKIGVLGTLDIVSGTLHHQLEAFNKYYASLETLIRDVGLSLEKKIVSVEHKAFRMISENGSWIAAEGKAFGLNGVVSFPVIEFDDNKAYPIVGKAYPIINGDSLWVNNGRAFPLTSGGAFLFTPPDINNNAFPMKNGNPIWITNGKAYPMIHVNELPKFDDKKLLMIRDTEFSMIKGNALFITKNEAPLRIEVENPYWIIEEDDEFQLITEEEIKNQVCAIVTTIDDLSGQSNKSIRTIKGARQKLLDMIIGLEGGSAY